MPAHRGGKTETKLAQWRLHRGLSQAHLPRMVGLTRTTYRRLERGKVSNPRLRMLVNCAIALDCPNGVDDLIEDAWREWFPFDRSEAAEPPRTTYSS